MSSWKSALWETTGFLAPVLLVVAMALVLLIPSDQRTTLAPVPDNCAAYYVDAERFRIAVPPRHDATDIDLRDAQMMQAYATMYLACVQRENR